MPRPSGDKHPQRERALLRRVQLARQMRLAGERAGDFEGQYMMLDASTLQKSPLYQRPFSQDRAINIALEFDTRGFHAMSVARRPDGSLYYMDGQHRLVGAQLAKGDHVLVPCMVYDVATVQDEARVYNLVNINRRGLATADKWQSRHTEEDPWVKEVEDLLGEFDLKAAPKRGKTAASPGEVVAVTVLEWALKKAGSQSIRETLGVLNAVFGDAPEGYREHFLRGVWHFIIRFPGYRPERLRTVLMRHGYTWRPEFTGMDEGLSMALSIHQAYNKNEPPDRRLPPFPLAPKGKQSGYETNRAALAYRAARQEGGQDPKASAA